MSDGKEIIIDDSEDYGDSEDYDDFEDYGDSDETDTEGEYDVLDETGVDEVEGSENEDDCNPDDPDDPDASEDGNVPPNEDVVEAFKATPPNTRERKRVLDQLRRSFDSLKNRLRDYLYNKCEAEHRAVERKDKYLDASEERGSRGTSDAAVKAAREKHVAELERKIAFVRANEEKLKMCREFIANEKAIWGERKAAAIEDHQRDGERVDELREQSKKATNALRNFPSRKQLQHSVRENRSTRRAICKIMADEKTARKQAKKRCVVHVSPFNLTRLKALCPMEKRKLRTISLNRWRDKKRKRQEAQAPRN